MQEIAKKPVLIISASLLVMAGLAVAIFPFTRSMGPTSSKVDFYTVNLDISTIERGTYKEISWKGMPVIDYRPDPNGIEYLINMNEKVWGPPITKANVKSIYVYTPISTFKRCYLDDTSVLREWSREVPRGWYDPCHMGMWDYSGRTYKELNVPDGTKLDNLESVPYTLKNGILSIKP